MTAQKNFIVYLTSGKVMSWGPWDDRMVEKVMAGLQAGTPGWTNLNGDTGTVSLNHANVEAIEVKPAPF